MPREKQTFLRFFAILLAVVAGFAIAIYLDAPQKVWRGDASMMTSAIAALLILSTARIGVASWRSDTRVADFGHHAAKWAMMLGLIGTALGLSMQAATLASAGLASLGALSTALYTTACGVAASMLIEVMTFNLEAGRDAE